MQVSIFVPGVPVAQPRQRHAMIGGHARNYTPKNHPVNAFKAMIRLKWFEQITLTDFGDRLLCVKLAATFPIPKSKRKKVNDGCWKRGKPDCDNIAKAVLDALNGVAWEDDSQVVSLSVVKYQAGDFDTVGTRIIILTVD